MDNVYLTIIIATIATTIGNVISQTVITAIDKIKAKKNNRMS